MKSNRNYYLAALFPFLGFLILAFWVWKIGRHSGLPFDAALQHLVWSLRSSLATDFFSIYTRIFGDLGGTLFTVVVFIVLLILLKSKERIAAYYFAVSAAIPTAINSLVKFSVHRTRPMTMRLPAFIHQSGYSFASGHSLFATIFFSIIFIIFAPKIKSQAGKWILAIFCLLGLLLVMISRVYVGVHYPSDTIAGFFLGSTWLLLTYPTYKKYLKNCD